MQPTSSSAVSTPHPSSSAPPPSAMGASPAAALGSLHPNGLPTHWSEYFVPGTSVDHQRAVFDSISSMISSERLAQLTQDRTDIRMIVNECLSTRIARANRNSVLPRLDFRGLRLDGWTLPPDDGVFTRYPRLILSNINFRGAILQGAHFLNCQFNACELSGVDLTLTTLTNCGFAMITINSDTRFARREELNRYLLDTLGVKKGEDKSLSSVLKWSELINAVVTVDRAIEGLPLRLPAGPTLYPLPRSATGRQSVPTKQAEFIRQCNQLKRLLGPDQTDQLRYLFRFSFVNHVTHDAIMKRMDPESCENPAMGMVLTWIAQNISHTVGIPVPELLRWMMDPTSGTLH